MRLVSYRHPDGVRAAALIASAGGDRVLDLSGELASIVSDAATLDAAREAVAAAQADELPRLADVELAPPVRPGKIICLGYNYRGHIADGSTEGEPDPEFPDVFVKTPNVLIGADDAVVLPVVPADVDYEGEIALVIGRRAKDIRLEAALEHIAGYTLFNDVTARDWQRRTTQWALGKSFDTFGPLGPWIVTPDEVADPHDLLVEVIRDGKVTVSQSTSTMIFSMAFVVHYLSTVMTLEPGDIISTGTPQKLPDAQRDHRSLADGDAVTVRVGGIGELTTVFANPAGGRP
jgi:2-keto-4-pentenoate hydratase/2-oxohepta-3-ene-1,7-dioic acid hydratase in catechol pathway